MRLEKNRSITVYMNTSMYFLTHTHTCMHTHRGMCAVCRHQYSQVVVVVWVAVQVVFI